ncbi:ATPase AAA [Planctomycetales bacterium]|nr:ATPase AAA [Planctomycetales bacterium]
MSWRNILGHDKLLKRFQLALRRGRLAGSFLFVGPAGVGKRRFAFALAQGLLCRTSTDLAPCGTCNSCRLFNASPNVTDWSFDKNFLSPHPDLYYVCKPEDKSTLPVELIVGDKKQRGKSGMCYDISRTPFIGRRKVAIINDADFFRQEAANALLKTLEEPPSDSVIILIGTSTAKQLPTIRSRCQVVRFSLLPDDVLAKLLVEQNIVSSLEQARQLAVQAEGSLETAAELLDNDIEALRRDVAQYLSAQSVDAVGFAAKAIQYVEAASKEPQVKRKRLRLLLNLSAEFFRNQMKNADETIIAAKHLERTLDALGQVDRNVNLPLIVEAWSIGLEMV